MKQRTQARRATKAKATETKAIETKAIETKAIETKATENVETNDAVVEADIRRPKSVVPSRYKATYARAAVLRGQTTRAAKRCNGDWLARELEAECVTDGKTFEMTRFLSILEANGIESPLERWKNRNNGWQGRLRMSGAIVLRGIVRKTGVLVTPDTTIQAPEAFLAKGA